MDIGQLNVDAVMSDETVNFLTPNEPSANDTVYIKIRTLTGDADSVFIIYYGERYEMLLSETRGAFDFYTFKALPEREVREYFFEIVKKGKKYIYSKIGFTETSRDAVPFKIIRDFKTPSWSKGAVMYQIYTDRFYDGDKENNVKTREYMYLGKPVKFVGDFSAPPENNDVRNFYGGDIQGVIDKLPYLKALGVEAVYFNPLFVSPSNHKYDTQDYEHIDPHFGVIENNGGSVLDNGEASNKNASMYRIRTTDKSNLEKSDGLFCTLVKKAHENGIRIILDGVFNHCGAFSKWLDREEIYGGAEKNESGAYGNAESRYRGYFKWKDEMTYDAWWGFINHPKLNYENSEELYNYMMDIAKKWVSPPFCADGWRLDVAADLAYSESFNHRFWRDFRKTVKSANENALILAEHYGNAEAWLSGEEWDTVMNYDAFMEPISWFLTGMEKHSDFYREELFCNSEAFIASMTKTMASLPSQSLMCAMNQLSNHDHSRFLTRTNQSVGRLGLKASAAAEENINKGIFREAVVFQMTWTGAPTLYYGDEAGLCGWTDPDSRRAYPWGKEDKRLIDFYAETIKLRKAFPSLRYGSVKFLYNEYGIISYARFLEEESLVIALNNNSCAKTVTIPVWPAEIRPYDSLSVLIATDSEGFCTEKRLYKAENGAVELTLPAFSSIVLLKEIP